VSQRIEGRIGKVKWGITKTKNKGKNRVCVNLLNPIDLERGVGIQSEQTLKTCDSSQPQHEYGGEGRTDGGDGWGQDQAAVFQIKKRRRELGLMGREREDSYSKAQYPSFRQDGGGIYCPGGHTSVKKTPEGLRTKTKPGKTPKGMKVKLALKKQKALKRTSESDGQVEEVIQNWARPDVS